MKTRYVVTDREGNISFSTKTNLAECFHTWGAAEKRAREIADLDRGYTIRIFKLCAEVEAPVGEISIKRT